METYFVLSATEAQVLLLDVIETKQNLDSP